MTNLQSAEREFAAVLAKDFTDEGYQQLDPSRANLPAGYVPDLMSKRGDEVAVVELRSRRGASRSRKSAAVEGGCRAEAKLAFSAFMCLPRQGKRISTTSRMSINRWRLRIASTREGQFEAASVVLWIPLETSLRVLLTHRQSRPNPGLSGVSMARRLMRTATWMTPISIS
jgi:hypothetical protein